MILTVTGGTKIQRQLVEEIANFVHAKLMPRQHNIEVNVELVRNLNEKEGAFGWCTDEGDKEYTVTIDSSSQISAMLQTVAHEMVHVKQYARNELKQLARQPMYRWKNEYLPLETPYYDQPWEKEAYELEEELYKEWSNTRNG